MRRAVAACREEPPVCGELDAADNTETAISQTTITTGKAKAWAHAPLVAEGKLQSDVEDTRYVWVEERGPILATLAVLGRPRIWVDVVRVGRRCCG